MAAVHRKCSRTSRSPLQEMKSKRRTIQFSLVCARWCADVDENVGCSEFLQDIMTKYNEVNCVDKLTWCETLILSRRWSS